MMMPGSQTNPRKPKLNGMREFQNFNDEEKLYWNEKLQQYPGKHSNGHSLFGSSTDVNRSTQNKKDTNGFQTYQNFLEEKLGWNEKVGEMLNLKNGKQHPNPAPGMQHYRSYFQSYESAAARYLYLY